MYGLGSLGSGSLPDGGGAVGVHLAGYVLGQGRRDDDQVIGNRTQPNPGKL